MVYLECICTCKKNNLTSLWLKSIERDHLYIYYDTNTTALSTAYELPVIPFRPGSKCLQTNNT